MIFESHIHLNDKKYQVKEQLTKARLAGVSRFLTVSYNLDSAKKNIQVANQEADVYLAVGIHPNEVVCTEELKQLEQLINNKKVIAIGEIGLDYHYQHDKQLQQEMFIKQIALANKYDLPIIVHSRDAAADTYNILKQYPCVNKGVMHCYSYSLEMAQKFIALGYYISFAGPITFKNAHQLSAVAAALPLEKMLVETDGPYLAPHPYRGQLNEAWMIKLVVDKLAELKNFKTEEVAQVTYNNAIKVFKIDE